MSPLATPAPRQHSRQYALIVLEALLAISAAAGAIGLVSGTMPLGDMADRLPGQSPVVGGVALALVVAIPAAVVAVAAWRRRWWAAWSHVVVGATLIGWIVVETGFIGMTSRLQPTLLVWGVAILGLALGRRPWDEV
jgi:hypothetical protein